ncbi:hypothetical protein [Hyalangium versicolor]|uniref:hypothetical protein n=1 Tax=Hyalangium versicolor TaxID=2861190 RepID=UPI001CCA2AD1|nr:hypothetical protein [Hyalangium versicolor]
MPRPTSVLLVASWLAVPGLAMAQEDLTPQKIAEIRRDEQASQAKVNAAYGNRKPSEMSNEERGQAAREQQAAGMAVLEKHGVSDKEYSRHVARMGREESAAVAREEKKLDDEAKAAQAARDAKAAEKKRIEEEGLPPDQIPVQRGFSDENPVVLESTGDDVVEVEEGLPASEEGLEAMPAGDATVPVEEAAPAAPAPSHGKKSKKKK